MSVGTNPTKQVIDGEFMGICHDLRDIAQRIKNLQQIINGQGNGLTFLTSIGYDNATAGGVGSGGGGAPTNPGNLTDAAWANQIAADLNNIQQIWYGVIGFATVGQSAVALDYDVVMAPLMGGRSS